MATRKEYDGYSTATSITSNDLIKYKDGTSGTVYKITEENLSAQIFDDIKSTDGTLADNSDEVVPTEKAVKTYADTKLANIVEDTSPQLGGDLDGNANYIDNIEGLSVPMKPPAAPCYPYFGVSVGMGAYDDGGSNSLTVGLHAVNYGRSSTITQAIGCFDIDDDNLSKGDALSVRFMGRVKTTNATPKVIYGEDINIDAFRYRIRSGGIYACTITVNGSNSDGTVAGFYKRMAHIKNISGTTSLIGTVQTIGTDIEVGGIGGIAIYANNTNDRLDVTATGKADTTIRWVMLIDAVEVGFY